MVVHDNLVTWLQSQEQHLRQHFTLCKHDTTPGTFEEMSRQFPISGHRTPEENSSGYGALKELNESSHFSLVVVSFGLKHFSFVSPKIP